MNLNENGLIPASWEPTQSYTPISEGAVVGISFGWIIGVLALYLAGMCLICKCVQNRREEDSEGSEENERKESG